MAYRQVIEIDGKEVEFCVSGSTYILYKSHFKRDLFKDFKTFENVTEDGEVSDDAMEVLMRAGFIMAKQATPGPETFEEWLDQFSLIGLGNDIPKVAALIVRDRETTEEAKKKNLQSAK